MGFWHGCSTRDSDATTARSLAKIPRCSKEDLVSDLTLVVVASAIGIAVVGAMVLAAWL
jgi:hypothetical protein